MSNMDDNSPESFTLFLRRMMEFGVIRIRNDKPTKAAQPLEKTLLNLKTTLETEYANDGTEHSKARQGLEYPELRFAEGKMAGLQTAIVCVCDYLDEV